MNWKKRGLSQNIAVFAWFLASFILLFLINNEMEVATILIGFLMSVVAIGLKNISHEETLHELQIIRQSLDRLEVHFIGDKEDTK